MSFVFGVKGGLMVTLLTYSVSDEQMYSKRSCNWILRCNCLFSNCCKSVFDGEVEEQSFRISG